MLRLHIASDLLWDQLQKTLEARSKLSDIGAGVEGASKRIKLPVPRALICRMIAVHADAKMHNIL